MLFMPQAQVPDALHALNMGIRPWSWVVRTDVPPAQVSGQIQEELRAVTGAPVTDIDSMEEIISVSTSRQQLNMLLMTVFGVSALLLAAIGIYGLMAYSVQQRTQEIGIRMAMGAEGAAVRGMIVRQGMILAVVGLVVGLVGAYFLASLLGSFLYEVEPRDMTAFTVVTVVLGLISFLAVAIPAGRASRVDPIRALRYE